MCVCPSNSSVATKQEPREAPGRDTRPNPTRATLVLSGTLGAGSIEAILAAISRVTGDGVASTIVEFDETCAAETTELAKFVEQIMALRERGVQVQIVAREDGLQDTMAKLPHSRDWLLGRETDASSAPRKALHVDGPAA